MVSCGTAPLMSLFSTTTGDQWSPLRQYSTTALRFPSPPLSRLCRQLPSMGAIRNTAFTKSLSLRRGARRAEWWFSTRRHLDVTFQHYHRRPMVAPTTVFGLCSPFLLSTPQSTLSTAPLYGSLICLSLRRGARRAEWWFSTRRHLDVTFQHYHGRPMVAPTTVFHCPKIQKEKSLTSLFYYPSYLTP